MISIIVPLYNEGYRAAESVTQLRELGGDYEVILVDASDQQQSISEFEKLKRRARGWSNIQVVSADTIGRAAQMNMGAKIAGGDILLFLHCDTSLPVDALGSIEKFTMSGYEWGHFEVALDARGIIYRVIEKMINLRSRVRHIATGDQAIFMTAPLFASCGGYPEIALMEDVAICVKLNTHSRPALVDDVVRTSARRWQNRGPVKTIFLMWKIRLLYWLRVDSQRLARIYKNER